MAELYLRPDKIQNESIESIKIKDGTITTEDLAPSVLANYITDAASDDQEYVRKNGAWVVNSGGSGGITDVQIDTTSLVTGGVASIPTATSSVKGVVTVDATISAASGNPIAASGVNTAIETAKTELTDYVDDQIADIKGSSTKTIDDLDTAITTEITDRQTAITTEVTNRDTAIANAIADEVTNRNTAITTAITAEETARDEAIAAAIDDEVIARDAAITTAINALDKADSAVVDQYVTAVSEADGIITVTRVNLPVKDVISNGASLVTDNVADIPLAAGDNPGLATITVDVDESSSTLTKYTINQNGTALQVINVPKDTMGADGSIIDYAVEADRHWYTEYSLDTTKKYLMLTFGSGDPSFIATSEFGLTIDSTLSTSSTNPLENKVIGNALMATTGTSAVSSAIASTISNKSSVISALNEVEANKVEKIGLADETTEYSASNMKITIPAATNSAYGVIKDAPSDTKSYIRKDGEWEEADVCLWEINDTTDTVALKEKPAKIMIQHASDASAFNGLIIGDEDMNASLTIASQKDSGGISELVIETPSNKRTYIGLSCMEDGSDNASVVLEAMADSSIYKELMLTPTSATINSKEIATIDDIPEVFTGATASADGTTGIVPAPTSGDNEKFLAGDGTWKEVDSCLWQETSGTIALKEAPDIVRLQYNVNATDTHGIGIGDEDGIASLQMFSVKDTEAIVDWALELPSNKRAYLGMSTSASDIMVELEARNGSDAHTLKVTPEGCYADDKVIVTEAPIDTKEYVRKDGEWVESSGGGDTLWTLESGILANESTDVDTVKVNNADGVELYLEKNLAYLGSITGEDYALSVNMDVNTIYAECRDDVDDVQLITAGLDADEKNFFIDIDTDNRVTINNSNVILKNVTGSGIVVDDSGIKLESFDDDGNSSVRLKLKSEGDERGLYFNTWDASTDLLTLHDRHAEITSSDIGKFEMDTQLITLQDAESHTIKTDRSYTTPPFATQWIAGACAKFVNVGTGAIYNWVYEKHDNTNLLECWVSYSDKATLVCYNGVWEYYNAVISNETIVAFRSSHTALHTLSGNKTDTSINLGSGAVVLNGSNPLGTSYQVNDKLALESQILAATSSEVDKITDGNNTINADRTFTNPDPLNGAWDRFTEVTSGYSFIFNTSTKRWENGSYYLQYNGNNVWSWYGSAAGTGTINDTPVTSDSIAGKFTKSTTAVRLEFPVISGKLRPIQYLHRIKNSYITIEYISDNSDAMDSATVASMWTGNKLVGAKLYYLYNMTTTGMQYIPCCCIIGKTSGTISGTLISGIQAFAWGNEYYALYGFPTSLNVGNFLDNVSEY